MKSGGTVSNTLGTVAVMYSLFHVVADNVLPEGEGDGTMEAVKSCVSGAATGALYKSGAGLKSVGWPELLAWVRLPSGHSCSNGTDVSRITFEPGIIKKRPHHQGAHFGSPPTSLSCRFPSTT